MSGMNLLELKKGQQGIVMDFDRSDAELETRLREIGFAEGDQVELRHRGLFGANPMSVRLNGAHIAMRRREAAAVLIRLVEHA